jgi:hypothetical protein
LVQDAINEINAAFVNNGNQPVRVVIVGHGSPSNISVGAGITNTEGRQLSLLFPADVTNFTNALNGEISYLMLFGCNVGQDTALQTQLANGLHRAGGTSVTVVAFDQETMTTPPKGNQAGFYSVDVDATLQSVVVG